MIERISRTFWETGLDRGFGRNIWNEGNLKFKLENVKAKLKM